MDESQNYDVALKPDQKKEYTLSVSIYFLAFHVKSYLCDRKSVVAWGLQRRGAEYPSNMRVK